MLRFNGFKNIVFLSMVLMPSVAASQNASPVAMVLQVEGTVTVQRSGAKRPARLADLLYAEDQISTSTNSKTVIGFCPTSQKLALGPAATISLSKSTARTLGGGAPITTNFKCELPQVALGAENLERFGAMRARGEESLVLYTGGPIAASRPHFQWEPVPAARSYRVSVTDRFGNSVWSWQQAAHVNAVRLTEPAPQLKPGAYFWELVAEADEKVIGRQRMAFTIKPDNVLSGETTDPGERLAQAIALENAGYFGEAAAIFRSIRDLNPGDSRLSRHLIWLYSRANLINARDVESDRARTK